MKPFQPGPGRIAPSNKNGKKGHSTIISAREYSIDIHKCIHGVGFKRTERKSATKEVGTPDVCLDPRLNKAAWAKGIRNIPYRTHLWLSQKTIRGWRFTKQAVHVGYLCTCHHFQKSTDS